MSNRIGSKTLVAGDAVSSWRVLRLFPRSATMQSLQLISTVNTVKITGNTPIGNTKSVHVLILGTTGWVIGREL